MLSEVIEFDCIVDIIVLLKLMIMFLVSVHLSQHMFYYECLQQLFELES